MKKPSPLSISVIAHIVVILLSYTNINGLFSSRKIKDPGYVVFDFVEIGSKSKAPILSDKEGKLSKTKSHSEDKEVVHQESQPVESTKGDDSPKKADNSSKKKGDDDAIALKKKRTDKNKKTEKKKSVSKKKSSDKAAVNLRKNKKTKSKTDPQSAKKSFDSLLDGAMADGDNENSGIKAEEVGATLTATQIDLIRQTIRKCWHFPAGLRNAEDLVVDIKMELDNEGNVKKAEIVDKNRMTNDPDFRVAAENAHRAVLDPNCNPLPLPKERYEEWKDLELSFNPKDMFS